MYPLIHAQCTNKSRKQFDQRGKIYALHLLFVHRFMFRKRFHKALGMHNGKESLKIDYNEQFIGKA